MKSTRGWAGPQARRLGACAAEKSTKDVKDIKDHKDSRRTAGTINSGLGVILCVLEVLVVPGVLYVQQISPLYPEDTPVPRGGRRQSCVFNDKLCQPVLTLFLGVSETRNP